MRGGLSCFGNLNREIHVWWCHLDQPRELVDKYYEVLSETEKRRVVLYKTAQLRERHTVARGALKTLMGLYLHRAPERVELTSGRFGKPLLVRENEDPDLQFSASHSSHIAGYTFVQNRLIGVDVEEVAGLADWEGVLNTCLSAYETEWFSRLASTRKAETFFRIWTIKEAYLKATGMGLSVSPRDIEVRSAGRNKYRFHRIHGEIHATRPWRIAPFTPATTFPASVVVEGRPMQIKSFCWEPDRLLKSKSLCSSLSPSLRIAR